MYCVQQALETGVVRRCIGVPGRGDDTNLTPLLEQPEQPRNDGVIVHQTRAVVVERDIAVKSNQVQAGRAQQAEDLRGVENQPDIVERGRDEAAPADEAVGVLVLECILQREFGEEGAYGGDEVFEFGLAGGVGLFVINLLSISHVLGVGFRGCRGDADYDPE